MLAGLTLELYNGVLKQLQFLCSKFLDVTKIFRTFAVSYGLIQVLRHDILVNYEALCFDLVG